MKRLLLALCLLSMATTTFAFDSTKRVERIGVLRGVSGGPLMMADALRRELRSRGFDAFDVERSFEEVNEDPSDIADYYVEIVGVPYTADYGGIGVSGRHAAVDVGVVVSRVAAELRVYDGTTMELLATENLSKRSTALLPTGVAVGGGAIYTYLAFPFIERVQQRNVARAAARDAASIVIAALRAQR
jgi:hypothetical protein